MSYTTYKAGPPRGRGGFMSRGGHRGGLGGGSNWGGGGRGRGGDYSAPRSSRGSRGGGSWHRESPSASYDLGRGSSSGRYVDLGDERYSSRSREESSYRRYRQESPGYSGMEMHSRHRSPEIPRKRIRSDHGYIQASSHHRSHESFEYSPRYSGYQEKPYERYREERPSRSYREHHEHPRERYSSPRDELMQHHRKEHKEGVMDRHEMLPPPPPSVTRHSASVRRPFRGRGGLERGGGRGLRSRPTVLRGLTRGARAPMVVRKAEALALAKRKTLMDASYVIKKKTVLARSNLEQLKKIRMQKMRRMENLDLEEGKEAKAKSENWEDELGVMEEEEVEEEEDEQASEEPQPQDEDKPSGAPPPEEEDEAAAVATADSAEDLPDKKAMEEPTDSSSVQVTIKQNLEGRAVSEEGKPVARAGGRHFIRLQCPHCHERCITFRQYMIHLNSSKHVNAMNRLMLRQKQTVLRMRQLQRKQQREQEETETDTLTKFSSYCPVCKLNYRQNRSVHIASKMHMDMKKLIFPHCKTCGISFKASQLYDRHICSLDHIRREAYLEERLKQMEGGKREREGEEHEMDMDDFMIVDSVGDVDDAEDLNIQKEKEKIEVDTLVGLEYVKTVEAQYCELCRRYLPRLDDALRAQAVHCRSSQHLRLHREETRVTRQSKLLQEQGDSAALNGDEQVKSNSTAEQPEVKPSSGKKDGDAATSSTEPASGQNDESASSTKEVKTEASQDPKGDEEEDEAEEGQEEKLWEDVDKDLGELLKDVDHPEEEEEEEEEAGAKSSDDDESLVDYESGRYDRFRHSEHGEATKGTKPAAGKGADIKAASETGK